MDSLKSLPIVNESQQHLEGKSSDKKNKNINIELVQNSANWLRSVLDLSIFGFDVVVSNSSLLLLCFYLLFIILFSFWFVGEGSFMFHVHPNKEVADWICQILMVFFDVLVPLLYIPVVYALRQ